MATAAHQPGSACFCPSCFVVDLDPYPSILGEVDHVLRPRAAVIPEGYDAFDVWVLIEHADVSQDGRSPSAPRSLSILLVDRHRDDPVAEQTPVDIGVMVGAAAGRLPVDDHGAWGQFG